ncbi:MAG: hypothetical protein ACI9MS_001193 [Glaciecola sp.]
MPSLLSTPQLKDITRNKLYPAYKTVKGLAIQLNGTKTLLPKGDTLSALITFADECGLKTVIITGGSESRHSKGSFHGKGLAVDVAGTKYNNLTHSAALLAAKKAGFTHGAYEDFTGSRKDHWHFQIGAGNGLGDKHSLNLPKLYIKKY